MNGAGGVVAGVADHGLYVGDDGVEVGRDDRELDLPRVPPDLRRRRRIRHGRIAAGVERARCPGPGFEPSEAALKIARSKAIEATELDLKQPIDRLEVRRADVVISTEVAEHLLARFAETFVEYLCQTADTVVMTAATPGQGATGHVNEQPNEYWIEKFRGRDFEYDLERTMRLRRECEAAKVVSFYSQNLVIFNKSRNGAPPLSTSRESESALTTRR
jgi:hypothetical protein